MSLGDEGAFPKCSPLSKIKETRDRGARWLVVLIQWSTGRYPALGFLSICGPLVFTAEIENKVVETCLGPKMTDTFSSYMTQNKRGCDK